jgi:ankyrin repeat protein
MSIWRAAEAGDLAEVERLLEGDPGLLDRRTGPYGRTPLELASEAGHVEVVRSLLDKGAALNGWGYHRRTALWRACSRGVIPVVKVLLERGADPTIADDAGCTPLMIASCDGHIEVVRFLLGQPTARTTVNHRQTSGRTALFQACFFGLSGVARVLLESGADPTIRDLFGNTPVAIAKRCYPFPCIVTPEGRRECVAVLEVRLHSLFLSLP